MQEYRKTGIIISINPPYTDLILSGYKPMEFRRKIINSMLSNSETDRRLTIYLYETKNKHGSDMVVGAASLKDVYKVNFRKERYGKWNGFTATQNICKNILLSHFQSMTYEPKDKSFDKYLENIGFAPMPDFDYAVEFNSVIRYQKPKPISEFLNKDGKPFERPPQNMCYTYRN